MTVVDDMRTAAAGAAQALESAQNLGHQTRQVLEAHQSRLGMMGLQQVVAVLSATAESLLESIARLGTAKGEADDATGMIDTLPEAADAQTALTTAQGCVEKLAGAKSTAQAVVVDFEPHVTRAIQAVQGSQSAGELMGALSSFLDGVREGAQLVHVAHSASESGASAFQSG